MVAATRRVALALALVAFAFIAVGAAQAGTGQLRTVTSAADTVELPTIAAINAVRKEHGLRPVKLSPALTSAAEAHSSAMGADGFFTHESFDGTSFWQRIARFYSRKGFGRWTVGENLLWASPTVTPERAVELWLESPTHRRILLTPDWTEIGLAAVRVTNAPGTFGGLDVTIITADFGVRA